MLNNNKRALYESIMNNISKQLKETLSEFDTEYNDILIIGKDYRELIDKINEAKYNLEKLLKGKHEYRKDDLVSYLNKVGCKTLSSGMCYHGNKCQVIMEKYPWFSFEINKKDDWYVVDFINFKYNEGKMHSCYGVFKYPTNLRYFHDIVIKPENLKEWRFI